jgi:hypothetical protein
MLFNDESRSTVNDILLEKDNPNDRTHGTIKKFTGETDAEKIPVT